MRSTNRLAKEDEIAMELAIKYYGSFVCAKYKRLVRKRKLAYVAYCSISTLDSPSTYVGGT